MPLDLPPMPSTFSTSARMPTAPPPLASPVGLTVDHRWVPTAPQASIGVGVTGAHHSKNPNPNSIWGPAATAHTTTIWRRGGAPVATSHRPLSYNAPPLSSPPLPPSFSASDLKHPPFNPSSDNGNPFRHGVTRSRRGVQKTFCYLIE
jgi:hypothetical protein